MAIRHPSKRASNKGFDKFAVRSTSLCGIHWRGWVNSLRPRRNGRYNADDIFKCIFLKDNVWIPTKIALKFVPKGPINNIPAIIQIMAWRRPGDKSLSEPMMVSLLTHICVTRSQWVNSNTMWSFDFFAALKSFCADRVLRLTERRGGRTSVDWDMFSAVMWGAGSAKELSRWHWVLDIREIE